jgi:uncharacterized CHY-type Zn-finger protein
MESSNETFVRGVDIDPETRCAHWHSPLDIVAIKFKCCAGWYACYDCHLALAEHEPAVWSREEFNESAILCGACKSQLTVSEYLGCDSRCPNCGVGFNPGCAKHYNLYLAID